INRIVAEHEPAEKVPFTEETAPSPTPVDLPAPQPIAPGSVGRAGDWMQDADGGLHRIAYIHHNGEGTQVGVETGPSSGRITMSPDDVQAQFGVTIEPPTAVSKNGEMVRVGDVFQLDNETPYEVTAVTDDTDEGREGITIRAKNLSDPTGVHHTEWPGDQFEREPITIETRNQEIWRCGKCKSFVSPKDQTCKRCERFEQQMDALALGDVDVNVLRTQVVEAGAEHGAQSGEIDRTAIAASLVPILRPIGDPDTRQTVMREALFLLETEHGRQLRATLTDLGVAQGNINNYLDLPDNEREDVSRGNSIGIGDDVQAALRAYYQVETPEWHYVTNSADEGTPTIYRMAREYGYSIDGAMGAVQAYRDYFANDTLSPEQENEYGWMKADFETAIGAELDTAQKEAAPEPSQMPGEPEPTVAEAVTMRDEPQTTVAPTETAPAEEKQPAAEPPSTVLSDMIADGSAIMDAKGKARCGKCFAFVSPDDPTCKRCENMRSKIEGDLSNYPPEAVDNLIAFIEQLSQDPNINIADLPRKVHTDFETLCREAGVWHDINTQNKLTLAFTTYLRDSQEDRNEIKQQRQTPVSEPVDRPDAGEGDGTLAGDAPEYGSGIEENEPVADGRTDGDSANRRSDDRPDSGDRMHDAGSVDEPARGLAVSAGRGDNAGTGQPSSDVGNADTGRGGVGYRITDADNIGEGGPKTKYKNNVAAIRLLKQLEEEDRQATPEEQAILAKYVGWGGIPQAFDSWQVSPHNRNATWGNEYAELKELLTDAEWEAASASTPNAHYTSPTVINAMWQALEQMGYEGGNVLEPAAGVGHFYGLMPDEMRENSKRVAVELDDISARITRQLYPETDVRHSGYEKAGLPDDYFDMVVGNVPFGDYGVFDPDYTGPKEKLTRRIHNYFFAKTLDQTKPGGMVALITSRYTMDSPKHQYVREYLASQADMVGAVRLPNTAFKKNAGTEVTTDIIFLRKRAEGEPPGDTSWVETTTMNVPNSRGYNTDIPINEYFADNPDMMLGRMEATGTMYSDAQPQLADDGRDLGQALQTTVGKFPKDIASKTQQRCQCGAFLGVNGACNNPRCSTKQNVYRIAPTNMAGMMQHGELVIDGDVLCRYDKGNGQLETVQFKKTKSGKPPMGVQRATAALPLKEAGKRLLDLNLSHASDAELEAAQAELNEQYDEFVAKFGPLHSRGNLNSELKHDPQLPLLLSLENYDPDTGETTKADICHKRVINLTERPETADNAEDALMISLYEGGVNWARMHELTGIPVEELQTELTNAGYVFMLPDGRWELSEAYLSGDVKQKLKDAQAAAKLDPRFQANVDALLAVQPPTLKPSDIHIGFGAGWIPPEVIEEFTEHLLGGRIPVKYVPESATWYLDTNNFWGGYKDTTEWGVPGKNGNELLKDALNLKDTHITKQEPNGKGGTRRVTDHTATLDAREKQNKIKEEFQNWVWSDPDRSRRLADLYNNKFNRIVPREYRHPYRDDANFVFPGMNTSAFKLRNYQKDAVWRILQGDNTLLAHIVGAGKSATMITANMELKRLGVRNKPTHVMPKHTLKQYYEDFRRLYPGAKVLLVGNEDVSPKNRQRTMARIASEDWDAVLISQPSWERIPVSPQTEAAFLEQEVAKYAERIQALESEDNGYGYSRRKKNPSVKDLQKKKKRLEAKLEKAIAASQRDDGGLSFEQLGIDHVFADEVQAYKNLDFATKLTRMPGINAGKGSNRAMDMYMKTRYLQRRCKCGKFIGSNGVCPSCLHKTETIKGGVTFATATPLANSVVDMYTMQRYLQEDTLDEYGLGAADAWIAHYCETATSLEMKPSGDGWQPKTRIAKFKNVPESLRMFSEVADFQMNPDEMGLERPMLMGASDKDEYDLARQSFLAFAGQDALTDKDKLTPKFAHLKESQEWLEFEKARDEYRRPIIATAHFSPEQEDFFKECQRRADNLPADPREDNMLNILNDARKAALDYRMVDPDAPDDPNSKINMAVGNMLDIHQQHPGKTQMVFLDMGTPGRKKPSDVLRADLQKALQAQAQDLGGVDMDQLTHDAIDVLNTHTTGGQRRKKGGPIPPAVRSNLRAKLVTAGVPPTKAELAINDAQEALWRFKDAPRTFDLYNDMKDKMMAAGVPAEEIAFMHDAATDGKKLELYQKMNTGKLRFLFGSTDKMGTGVNAQKLMVAQHHIDPPRKMRPDEVEQRDGRILRHGNVNEEAMIYRYVTEPSPDAFAWGGIERKAGFIGQITRGDLNTREMEDIGGVELGFAELKAAASGDPTLIEFVQIEAELAKTESLERAYYNKTTSYKWKLAGMPQKEEKLEQAIATNTAALAAIKKPADNKFTMTVGGQQYEKVLESGEALQNIMEKEKAANRGENFSIPNAGELYGLPVTIEATYAPMIDDHKVWAVMQAGPKEMSVELSDK
ncbi:MAG: hypothetical protein GY803_23050, partial [Chloroflexi bacterium]|nr:hypothetical protein [Chloroflexota bacterium]